MTEQQWLASEDPQAMLHSLEREWDKGGTYYVISERKLRLFAAACVRIAYKDSVLDPETMPNGWTGRQYAQRWVDPNHHPQISPPDMRDRAMLLRCLAGNPYRRLYRNQYDGTTLMLEEWNDVSLVLVSIRGAGASLDDWLAWEGGVILRAAQMIYDQRRWEDLPILADALEEAGCDNADILAHLRGPGPHARGCHVLDLLLGKG